MDKKIDLRELRAKEQAEKRARIALNRLNEKIARQAAAKAAKKEAK